MTEVVTALTNGLGSIANDIAGAIGGILPIALPIMGAVVAITLGIRVFRKFTRG